MATNLSNSFVPGTFIRNVQPRYPITNAQGAGVATTGSSTGDMGNGYEVTPFVPYYSSPSSVSSPTENKKEMGEFRRAVARGKEQTQALGYGFVGLLGDLANLATGSEIATPVRDWGYEGFDRNMVQAAEYPKTVESFFDIENPLDAGLWALGTFGELLPNMAVAALTAGVGGAAARTLGGVALRKAGTNAVTRYMMVNNVGKEVAERAILADITKRGALQGVFASTGVLESGGSWGESVQTRGLGNTNPVMDLTVGAINGALEVIMGAEGSIIRSLTGRAVTDNVERSFRRILVGQLAKNAGQEFTTELLQETTNVINQNLQNSGFTEAFKPDDILRVFDAGMAGFVGGLGFGSVSSIIEASNKSRGPQTTTNVDAVLQALDRKQNPLSTTRSYTQPALTELENDYRNSIQELDSVFEETNNRLSQQETQLKLEREEHNTNPTPYSQGRLASLERELQDIAVQKAGILRSYTEQVNEINAAHRADQKKINTIEHKAFLEQHKLDSERAAQTVVTDPSVQRGIQQIMQNTHTLASRQDTALTERANRIRQNIAESKSHIDQAVRNAQNGTQQFMSDAEYDAVENNILAQQKKLKEVLAEQKKLRTAMGKLATDVAQITDVTLSDFFSSVQDIYLLSDATSATAYDFDIFADTQKMGQQALHTYIEEYAKATNDAIEREAAVTGLTPAQKNTLRNANSTIANTLEREAGQLALDRVSLQSRTDAKRAIENYKISVEEASLSLSDTAEGREAAERNADAVAQQQAQQQQEAQEDEEWDNDAIIAEWEQERASQQEQAQQDVNATVALEMEQTDILDVTATTDNMPIINDDPVIAALEQHVHLVRNGAEFVESLKPNVARVKKYLAYALGKQLPIIRDKVIIVEDENSPLLMNTGLFAEERAGTSNAIAAYFGDYGYIVILAKYIPNQSMALRTLIHEAVVHYGLDAILTPDQKRAFLQGVHRQFSKSAMWKDWIEGRGAAYANLDAIPMAEEFVAMFSEKIQLSQLLSRTENALLAKIKEFIHNVLKNLGMIDITEKEIRDILSYSAQYLAGKRQIQQQVEMNKRGSVQVRWSDGTTTVAEVDPNALPGKQFKELADAIIYNRNLDAVASGIPNIYFNNTTPSINNMILTDLPLREQVGFIQEMLSYIAEQSLIQITNNNGKYQFMFGTKQLFEADTTDALRYYIVREQWKDSVTGRAFLDEFLKTGNGVSREDTIQQLTLLGITGAQEGTKLLPTNVTLFRTKETALVPVQPEVPNRMNSIVTPLPGERANLYVDPTTGSIQTVQPDTGFAEERARQIEEKYKNQTNWITKIFGRAQQRGNLIVGQDIVPIDEFDRATIWLQDRYHAVRKAQMLFERNEGEDIINQHTNIYKNMLGLQNQTHARQERFDRTLLGPLRTALSSLDMQSVGISRKDPNRVEKAVEILGLYAHAKHAAERNRVVNERLRSNVIRDKDGNVKKIKKVKKDDISDSQIINASGMSNEEAAGLLQKYQNLTYKDREGNTHSIDDALQYLYRINDARLDILEEAGFIDNEDSMLMKDTYDFYTPLRMWEDLVDTYAPGYYQAWGGSNNISVGKKKPVQYAGGRKDMPYNPVVMSCFQLMDAVALAQRNKAAQSVLALAREDTKHEIFQEGKVEGEKVPLGIRRDGEGLIYFRKKEFGSQGSGNTHIYVVENKKVIPIEIKDRNVAAALTGKNMAPISSVTRAIGTVTRFLAALNTTYSPSFILTNPLRDIPTALMNLGNVISENESRGLLDKEATIRKGIVSDVKNKDVLRTLKNMLSNDEATINNFLANNPEMREYINDFIDFNDRGGHTRIYDFNTIESLYKGMIKDQDPQGFIGKTKESIGKIAKYLDSISDVTENLVRFATYRNVKNAFLSNIETRVKEGGLSQADYQTEVDLAKTKAAMISLEITVNFTKKGTASPVINALYAFSNATIQGTARILRNLWRPKDTTARNLRRVGTYLGTMGMGAMVMANMARMIMGDDDDGINKYDKIPDYIKYLNFIIPLPNGNYLKIPMPYGYHVFYVAGIVMDDILHGNKSPIKGATDIVRESFGGFSPVDPTEGISAWVPTVFKPIIQIAENRTFAGTPIYPENTLVQIPDSQKVWSKTPDAYRVIANFLNGATGGDKYQSGLIDISPESIEHVVSSYFGGLGRFMTDTLGLMSNAVTGQTWAAGDTPLVNRFLGEVGYQNTSSLYNQIGGQVDIANNAIKAAADDRNLTTTQRQQIEQQFNIPQAVLRTYRATERQLRRLSQREKALLQRYEGNRYSSAFTAQQEQIQAEREKIMKTFLRIANAQNLPLHANN